MPTTKQAPSVASHFADKSPAVLATYKSILDAARALGPVEEDPKRTSIHLNRDSAFAGVATRNDALILTLKSETSVRSPHIHEQQQASARRWYLEIRVTGPDDVDAELRTWLAASYEVS